MFCFWYLKAFRNRYNCEILEEGNGTLLQCSCLENPGMGKPGGLLSMGSHRVGHDWSDLAAAASVIKLLITYIMHWFYRIYDHVSVPRLRKQHIFLTGKVNARCLLLTYFSNNKILRKWPSQNVFFEFLLKIEANNAWNSLFWFLWQHLCSLWWNNVVVFFQSLHTLVLFCFFSFFHMWIHTQNIEACWQSCRFSCCQFYIIKSSNNLLQKG